VKRRKAIQQIGVGLSAGIILPGWLGSCKKDDPKPEIDYAGTVAVIGAGASGLYLADILLSKGIKVQVFEASDRAGGRIRNLRQFDQPTAALQFDQDSLPNSDFPTEVGAERIIGTDSLWATIIQQLNVPTVAYSTVASDHYFLDGVFTPAFVAEADPDFIAARNFMTTLSSYSGGNVSVQQAIQTAGINTRVQAILNSWIGNKQGTSNDRLGIKALAEGMSLLTRNEQELVLSSNPMQDVLLSRFSNAVANTQFNTAIKSIDYSGEKITISGERGIGGGGVESFSTVVDKVIVTAPVALLKAGTISFTPSLPAAKVTALSRMEMDPSLRVVVEFKKNFWGVDGSLTTGFLYGGTASPEYFNAGIGRSQFTKTLSLTINGPRAEQLSAMGNDAMIAELLGELDSIFDGAATLNVRKNLNDDTKVIAVVMDWSKEEYIKGGVSYLKPGGTNQDRITLAEAVDYKLFFAGEATAVAGDSGTVNGALLSAERAAQEVVDSILNA
jgi:monoamine oxidase